MPSPNPKGIYFDSAYLAEPSYDYVCWLDVMGTANQMLRSLPIAANFIYKLHCAVLEACDEVGALSRDVCLYPIMDGMYITSRRRGPLQQVLNQTMCRVALTFLNERKCFHQFLVRGAVAYGPVYHGSMVDPRTTAVWRDHSRIRDGILMGLPMAQAYRAERDAPPFGIAAHSSARGFAPDGDRPFRFIWLDWFRSCSPRIQAGDMLTALNTYFDWQAAHCVMQSYSPDRIEHHRKLATEYFTASDSGQPSQKASDDEPLGLHVVPDEAPGTA